MTATDELSTRLARPDGVRRLGQALWMLVGERVKSSADLLWAFALVGPRGDQLLWDALLESGCFDPEGQLLARPMGALLCSLWEPADKRETTLLWTLPEGFNVPGISPTGYADGVRALIRRTLRRLTLLAPYLEREGVGQLEQDLLSALARKVSVTVVAQDANSVGTWASDSLESLRREARGLPGTLCVYTAPTTAPVLLHSKLVAADGASAIIGSANLTGNALLRNLETGVELGARQAVEIERVVEGAIELKLVDFVFSNVVGADRKLTI